MNTTRGFGLVELMVSTALSLMLLAGAVQLYSTNVASVSRYSGATRLHHELRTVATMIHRDIRRAGYWADAETTLGTGSYDNPFGSVDLSTPGCAILRYDRNHDGKLNIDGSEQIGFALLDTTVLAYTPSAPDPTCAAKGWINLTNPSGVEVTELTFQLTERIASPASDSGKVRIQYIQVRISGRLRIDPAVTHTLVESIRVRNDPIDLS